MAINRESNGYTITFATIMVVIVGGLLAFVSMSLKPAQQANVDNEKMQNILQSIGIQETHGISRDEAGKVFSTYITRRLTINYNGEILSDKSVNDPIDSKDKLDAFNIDLRKEYSKFIKPIMNKTKGNPELLIEGLKNSTDIHFPIFVCENNGNTYYVLSASGKGLWDDIWGYISIKSDFKTVNGSSFDHKGETPGLGSKIKEDWFQDQFVGKVIANETEFTSINVLKPGATLNDHQVDGISGATFTGVGVQEMLKRNLVVYYNFFKSHPDFAGNTTSASTENGESNKTGTTEGNQVGIVSSLPFTGIFADDFNLLLQNFDKVNAGEEKSFIIEGIVFSAGSSKINMNSSKLTLNSILEGLKTMTAANVELSGHTDDKGEAEALNKLSLDRANSVKNYLVENGIEEVRISTVGYGSTKPVVENDSDENRAKNRRTEIKIIKSNLTANVN